jgi:hypothetical protein
MDSPARRLFNPRFISFVICLVSFTVRSQAGPDDDTDSDGLRDGLETAIGTDPMVADIDAVVGAIGGVRLHLRADLGVTLDGSSLVSDWADQSGLGNSATQSNPSLRQPVTSNAINGHPAISFANASGGFDLPNFMSGATQGEIFHVFRASPSPSAVRRSWTFPSGDSWYPLNDGQTFDSFGSSSRQGPPTVQDISQFHVYNVRTASGLWQSRINGALYLSSNSHTPWFGTGGSVRFGHPSGQNFGGEVAEIVAFDHVLTAIQREAIERYFNVRYAILTSAPAAPADLSIHQVSATQVNLSWTGALAEAGIFYEVQRQTGAGAYATVVELEDTQSYFDTVTAGTAYSYRVRARNPAGVSSFCTPVSITVDSLPMPAMPLTGIRLWLKADALAGDSRVHLWPDVSGNSQDANQSTVSGQPTRVASVVNGKPVIRFNGSNKRLLLPNFMSGATEGEVFAVVKSTPSSSLNQKLWYFGNGDTFFPLATSGGQGIQEAFGSSVAYVGQPPAASLSNFVIYNVSARSGVWASRLNASLYLARTENTVSFSGSPYLGLNGDIDLAEVIVYDRYLNETEREAVGAYLNAKYALGLDEAFDYFRDQNHDGLADGVDRQLGIDPTAMDVDGDGVANATELLNGTDPLKSDTDGDSHNDSADAFPLDPTRWNAPSGSPGDTTSPVITLTKPADAVLQP